MIWFKKITLKELNNICQKTMVEHIGINFIEVGNDYLKAEMEVNQKTIQPAGLLHGGASVTLAETIGSVGAYFTVDNKKKSCVGLEINANHVKSKKSGKVIGSGYPIHIGKSTQIWEIKIVDESNKLINICRLTMAVLDRV